MAIGSASAGPPSLGAAPVRRCPFCEAAAPGTLCPACGRDTTAARRPCKTCGRMALVNEPACWNCGTVVKSELRWKIPVIILMFVLAFILAIVLQLV